MRKRRPCTYLYILKRSSCPQRTRAWLHVAKRVHWKDGKRHGACVLSGQKAGFIIILCRSQSNTVFPTMIRLHPRRDIPLGILTNLQAINIIPVLFFQSTEYIQLQVICSDLLRKETIYILLPLKYHCQ